MVDKYRQPATASIDDEAVAHRAGTISGRLKVAAGCLNSIQVDRESWVIQQAVLNVIDIEKGYRIDSVQVLPLAAENPEAKVTATGYEECMQRVYAAIGTLPALDGWSPKPGTKRRVLVESAMPPGYGR